VTTLLLSPALFSQAAAIVEGDAHHHLFRVRRLQAGDALRVVDGAGAARAARVESVGKREAKLRIGDPAPSNEPAIDVDLYVAAPKPDRAAWLVEKATEVGARSISFLATERDARSLAPSQLERLRRIAVSALEQCGRSWLPPVADGGDLQGAVLRAKAAGHVLVALDGEGAREVPLAGSRGRCALFVGPEGGWSATECALFETERVALRSLGPTVLRVETAAVVAAALMVALRTGPEAIR
jgi:16S rRNA (uracil1498-N3)-methyltransferase